MSKEGLWREHDYLRLLAFIGGFKAQRLRG